MNCLVGLSASSVVGRLSGGGSWRVFNHQRSQNKKPHTICSSRHAYIMNNAAAFSRATTSRLFKRRQFNQTSHSRCHTNAAASLLTQPPDSVLPLGLGPRTQPTDRHTDTDTSSTANNTRLALCPAGTTNTQPTETHRQAQASQPDQDGALSLHRAHPLRPPPRVPRCHHAGLCHNAPHRGLRPRRYVGWDSLGVGVKSAALGDCGAV